MSLMTERTTGSKFKTRILVLGRLIRHGHLFPLVRLSTVSGLWGSPHFRRGRFSMQNDPVGTYAGESLR